MTNQLHWAYIEALRKKVNNGVLLRHQDGCDLLAEVERLRTSLPTRDGAEGVAEEEIAKTILDMDCAPSPAAAAILRRFRVTPLVAAHDAFKGTRHVYSLKQIEPVITKEAAEAATKRAT